MLFGKEKEREGVTEVTLHYYERHWNDASFNIQRRVAIGLLVLLGNLFTPAPANAGLWDTITDAVSDVVDAVESVVEEVVETVQEVAEEVVETVKEVIDSIKVALVGGVTHGRIEQCPLLS